jgi:hypothetical protein
MSWSPQGSRIARALTRDEFENEKEGGEKGRAEEKAEGLSMWPVWTIEKTRPGP